MRKILICTIIAASAMLSHAAAFNWKTSMSGKIYQPAETTTLVASSTAYLFDSLSIKQEEILATFKKGLLNLAEAGSISSATIANGAITRTSFTDSTAKGATLSAYFVALIGEGMNQKLFISDLSTATGMDEGKSATLTFDARTASQAAEMSALSGYQGAGWYSVPEPTSGLLMLLGMAGLALRRKLA